ncbi:DUF21 domain-containing protein [Streptosporangiaceae bacterium NEAU-GS5]|nr:DUF21 domain-containing protein [Streptosporangiaceae bacterium NEAU-GS5]
MLVDLTLSLAAATLIVANAVFVAAEFSLVTVERGQIHQLAAEGDRGAAGIAAAVRRLSFQLSGAQLGITITALMLGVIAEPAIAELLAPVLEAVPGVSEQASDEIAVVASLAGHRGSDGAG